MKEVSNVCQGCFNGVSGSFKEVSRVFKESFRVISSEFLGSFKERLNGVFMEFEVGFKNV